MKTLLTTVALIAIFGSSNILASEETNNFDWTGFSTEDCETQDIQIESNEDSIAYGFSWPAGFTTENSETQQLLTEASADNIDYGVNWPEGS